MSVSQYILLSYLTVVDSVPARLGKGQGAK